MKHFGTRLWSTDIESRYLFDEQAPLQQRQMTTIICTMKATSRLCKNIRGCNHFKSLAGCVTMSLPCLQKQLLPAKDVLCENF